MRNLDSAVKTPEDGALALLAAVIIQARRDAQRGDYQAQAFVWDTAPIVAERYRIPVPTVQLSLLEQV